MGLILPSQPKRFSNTKLPDRKPNLSSQKQAENKCLFLGQGSNQIKH